MENETVRFDIFEHTLVFNIFSSFVIIYLFSANGVGIIAILLFDYIRLTRHKIYTVYNFFYYGVFVLPIKQHKHVCSCKLLQTDGIFIAPFKEFQ